MAATLGSRLGDDIGLRARLSSKTSARVAVEVITEGVFTRMILDDPELKGVAAVLFDEFHERSLDADLGLALALDTRAALRPDLKILVMSATLEAARVAKLLGDAPVVMSEGRAFPVETRYAGRRGQRIEDDIVDTIRRAVAHETGSILVFLPGQGEINRVAERLSERSLSPSSTSCRFTALSIPAVQDRAIAAAETGRRKIVLATSIAETSITIEGVRVVIDSGLARVPRFEPDVGITRLETVRVSRASADQRRGPCRQDRARRLLPALGRARDAGSRAVRRARDQVGGSVGAFARLRRVGNQRPAFARMARSSGGGRSCRGTFGPSGHRRARRRGAHHRRRPAAQSLAAAATAGPHGAEIRRARVRPRRPPILRPSSSSGVSGATMPILAFG